MSPVEIERLVLRGDVAGVAEALLAEPPSPAEQRALEKHLAGYGARPWAEDVATSRWGARADPETYDAGVGRRRALAVARLAAAVTVAKARSALRLAGDSGGPGRDALLPFLLALRPPWASGVVAEWPRALADLHTQVTVVWAAAGVADLPPMALAGLDEFTGAPGPQGRRWRGEAVPGARNWEGWTRELTPTLVEAYLLGIRNGTGPLGFDVLGHLRAGRLPRERTISALVAELAAARRTTPSDLLLLGLLDRIGLSTQEWRACSAYLPALAGHRHVATAVRAVDVAVSLDDVEILRRVLGPVAGVLPGMGREPARHVLDVVEVALARGLAEEAADLAAAGFAHPRADVAEQALDLVLGSAELRTAHDFASEVDVLPPSVRGRAAVLQTSTGHRTDALQTPVSAALPPYRWQEPGPGEPLDPDPPDVEETRDLWRRLLQGERSPQVWDRLLLGVATHPGTEAGDPALTSLADSYDARWSLPSLGGVWPADVFDWWVGRPRDRSRDEMAELARQWDYDLFRRRPGREHPSDLWTARVRELCAVRPSGRPVVLLAPATCAHGTLDVNTLRARLDRLEGLGAEVLPADAQQALLRVRPDAFDELDGGDTAGLLARLGVGRPGGPVPPGPDHEVDLVRGTGVRPGWGAVRREGSGPGAVGHSQGWAVLTHPPEPDDEVGGRLYSHPSAFLRTAAPWHPRLVAAHLASVAAWDPFDPDPEICDYVLGAQGLLGTRGGALTAAVALGSRHGARRAAAVDVLVDGLTTGTADPVLLGEVLAQVVGSGGVSAGQLARTLGPLLVDPGLGPALGPLLRSQVPSFLQVGARDLGSLVAALVEGAAAVGAPPVSEPALLVVVDSGARSSAARALRRLVELVGR